MYESYYGLSDKPFSMLPDPGYLYLSKKHETALTLLEYALMNSACFCVITGEPGAGKTTLLRKLLESVDDSMSVGMITNTHKSFGELLDWVLSAFNIHEPGINKVEKNQRFVDFLLEQYANGKTTLLIVDEAQNMQADTLEELRMLSNINSEKDQVLQIILAGQPQLKEVLRQPELMQFAQRIAVDYHLDSLNLEETCGYIQHRLTVAGASRDVFTPRACEHIYQYSGGTPRLINLISDTALVYGFADHDEMIDENIIDLMVKERMRDSVVPLFKSIETGDEPVAPAAQSADDIEFPWIDPQGGEHGLKPEQDAAEAETAEKKTLKEAGSEETEDATEQQATEPASDEAGIEIEAQAGPADEAATEILPDDSEDVVEPPREPEPVAMQPQPQAAESDDTESIYTKTLELPAYQPPDHRWRWAAAGAASVVAAIVVVLVVLEHNERQQEEASRVIQERLERQQRMSQQLELELDRIREQTEARELELAEQAEAMQKERDEALARAKQEARLRADRERQVEEIRRQIEQTEQRLKKQAEQAVEQEQKKQQEIASRTEELEAELIEQRKRLYNMVSELEQAQREARQQQQEASRQAVLQTQLEASTPQAEATAPAEEEKDVEFAADPCSGPQARFVSNCR